MGALLQLSRVIDRVSTAIGRGVSWLILVAVIVSSVNAVIRKLFDVSSNSWLELQWVLFGAVFLLCSPWTLLSNEHIRIDIVNARLPRRVRDWIDIVGHTLFLMPFCIVIIVTAWQFTERSLPTWGEFSGAFHAAPWRWIPNLLSIGEQSANAGGLPQWPAKLLIIVAFVLLLVQAVSELIKRVAIMRGLLPDTPSGGGHHAAVEAEAERLLAAARTGDADLPSR